MWDAAPANTSYTEGVGGGITFVAGVASDAQINAANAASNSDDDDDGEGVATADWAQAVCNRMPPGMRLMIEHQPRPRTAPSRRRAPAPADPPIPRHMTRERWEGERASMVDKWKREQASKAAKMAKLKAVEAGEEEEEEAPVSVGGELATSANDTTAMTVQAPSEMAALGRGFIAAVAERMETEGTSGTISSCRSALMAERKAMEAVLEMERASQMAKLEEKKEAPPPEPSLPLMQPPPSCCPPSPPTSTVPLSTRVSTCDTTNRCEELGDQGVRKHQGKPLSRPLDALSRQMHNLRRHAIVVADTLLGASQELRTVSLCSHGRPTL